MTDQGKIPLPSEKVPESEAGSLIERAVKAFDLGRLAPPPVPEQFASAPRRPANTKPSRNSDRVSSTDNALRIVTPLHSAVSSVTVTSSAMMKLSSRATNAAAGDS